MSTSATFAAERPKPALDRLLNGPARELLPTQWAHRFPLLRPRRRPPLDLPGVAGSGSCSSDSSLSWSFMSCTRFDDRGLLATMQLAIRGRRDAAQER